MRIHRAVVIACSATKLNEPAPPKRLYTGVAWSTWRKHAPPAVPCGWSLWALSAEYGLVESWRTIDPYDRKMTPERVDLIAAHMRETWPERMAAEVMEYRRNDPVEVVVIGGALYQECAREGGLPVVWSIDGTTDDDSKGGIGIMRQRIARWADLVNRAGNATPDAEEAWPGGGSLLLNMIQ